MRVTLHRHRLLRIVGVDVLEDLLLGQRGAVLRVPREPQPRRLGVEVVGDAQIVLPRLDDLYLASLGLLSGLRGGRGLSKHIVIVAEVIQVEYFIVLLASACDLDHLYLILLVIVVEVQYLLIISSLFVLLFRILGLDPAIFEVDF